MLPNTGTLLPKKAVRITDAEFMSAVSTALVEDLGGSRRAVKSVMLWADVSERTARSWITGQTSPNGRHLTLLAANSHAVLIAFLRLSGNQTKTASLELAKIEAGLDLALKIVRSVGADAEGV